jgi:hypothetical protein
MKEALARRIGELEAELLAAKGAGGAGGGAVA